MDERTRLRVAAGAAILITLMLLAALLVQRGTPT